MRTVSTKDKFCTLFETFNFRSSFVNSFSGYNIVKANDTINVVNNITLSRN